jgi:thioredoxin-like negative regulator of GroEL
VRRRWAAELSLAAICAAALAGAACARIPMRPRGDWLRADTPHFEIASGLSARRTRELGARLERFQTVALAFAELPEPPRAVPTRVLLLPRARNFAALRPRREFSGFFQPAAHASFLAIDASADEAGIQIAQHELVHLLQISAERAPAPAWVREGLADLLATARFTGDEAEIGGPPEGHLALARAAPLPFTAVLEAQDVLRWKGRELGAFYAQSWALAHYLHLGSGAPPRGALKHYLALLEAGRSAPDACQVAFARSPEQLERDVLAHLERRELPRTRVPAPALLAPRRIALRALADADRDALLGDVALALGERRWRRADGWLRAALAADPQHAFARASLAWLLAQRGEPEAGAVLELAAAARDADAETARRVGEAQLALAQRASESGRRRELFALAEASFARSLALDPAHPSARLALGRLALARGEPARAAQELAALRGALPALPAVDLALAESLQQAGRPEQALAALARVRARAHATSKRERAALDELLRSAGVDPDDAAAGRRRAARLDVHDPAPGAAAVTDLPWLELRGKAGLWEAELQDIALVLDVSNSTLDATGVDIDGDGRVGRTVGKQYRPPDSRRGSSDRGDSIVRAELAAAEQLLRELDPATTRVSLTFFTASARLAAPLGAPREALAKLKRHRVRYDPTGTSFEAALRVAFDDLLARRRPATRSQRTILMLSDGEPTAPNKFEARRRALQIADEIGRFGIRIHGYALGKDAAKKSETLRELAERTGGAFEIVSELDDVSFLRDARLTGLEQVTIRNERSRAAARAVRTFADGSFDAIVPLRTGVNALEIRARIRGQPELTLRRVVRRTEPSRADESHARRERELRDALARRTAEIAARARLEAERGARALRALEIRADEREPDVATGPPPPE